MATMLQIAPYLGPSPEWMDNLLFTDANPLPVFSRDVTTLSTSSTTVDEVRRGGSGILFTYSGTTYVIDEVTALRFFLGDRAKYKWRVYDSTASTVLAGPYTFRFFRSTYTTLNAVPYEVPHPADPPYKLSYDLFEMKVISSAPWKK